MIVRDLTHRVRCNANFFVNWNISIFVDLDWVTMSSVASFGVQTTLRCNATVVEKCANASGVSTHWSCRCSYCTLYWFSGAPGGEGITSFWITESLSFVGEVGRPLLRTHQNEWLTQDHCFNSQAVFKKEQFLKLPMDFQHCQNHSQCQWNSFSWEIWNDSYVSFLLMSSSQGYGKPVGSGLCR